MTQSAANRSLSQIRRYGGKYRDAKQVPERPIRKSAGRAPLRSRTECDSRQVGYGINDLQGTPNEAGQLIEVEHLGGVAGGIIAAKIVPRVGVDLVELIEKCASRM